MTDKLDPILTKVLWSRLISIVDEAATGLIRTSYSIVVRDYYDFCVGLFDADGNMLAHSTKTTPGFIGMMPLVMKHFLKVYPVNGIRMGTFSSRTIRGLQRGIFSTLPWQRRFSSRARSLASRSASCITSTWAGACRASS